MTVINLLLCLIHKLFIICTHRKSSIQRIWCCGFRHPLGVLECTSHPADKRGLLCIDPGKDWLDPPGFCPTLLRETGSPIQGLRPSDISCSVFQSAFSEVGNNNSLPIIVEQGSPRGLCVFSSKKELASLRWGRRARFVYRALPLHEDL